MTDVALTSNRGRFFSSFMRSRPLARVRTAMQVQHRDEKDLLEVGPVRNAVTRLTKSPRGLAQMKVRL
jgi:hypothetical protein